LEIPPQMQIHSVFHIALLEPYPMARSRFAVTFESMATSRTYHL